MDSRRRYCEKQTEKNMSDRRTFLKGSLIATLALGAAQAKETEGELASSQWISIIDLDRCDGCEGSSVPACVNACRQFNEDRFPKPAKPLQPYWPQKTYEDFSNSRDRIDRLTPYNWLYIEKIVIQNGKTVFAPRRCMHCFDAPCRKICPFGAIERSEQGALQINPDVCFGGAKCRDVCPWQVPQRQAGVGIYLKVAPKFAGGGVMYKCDFCAERLKKGETPVCAQSCPQNAMSFLPLKEAVSKLREIARGRYVYGLNENGGTATWYVSSVPFEEIRSVMQKGKKAETNDGRAGFPAVEPALEASSGWALATLAAPVVAIGAAYLIAKRKKNQNQTESEVEK